MKTETQKKSDNISAKELLDNIEKYREQLFNTASVKSTRFDNMQSALHNVKLIIHHMAGTKIEREECMAWVKLSNPYNPVTRLINI